MTTTIDTTKIRQDLGDLRTETGATWRDKPHRVVYDLCDEIDRLRLAADTMAARLLERDREAARLIGERDEINQARATVQAECDTLRTERDFARGARDDLRATVAHLDDKVARITAQRDEAHVALAEATAKAQKAQVEVSTGDRFIVRWPHRGDRGNPLGADGQWLEDTASGEVVYGHQGEPEDMCLGRDLDVFVDSLNGVEMERRRAIARAEKAERQVAALRATLSAFVPEKMEHHPNEPIGGGNPYRRCSSCKRSDPEISVRGHYDDCEWLRRQSETSAARTALADTEAVAERFVDVDSDEMRALLESAAFCAVGRCAVAPNGAPSTEQVAQDLDGFIADFKAKRSAR